MLSNYFSIFNSLSTDAKLPTKGKPTPKSQIKQMDLNEVDDLDNISLSGSSQGHSEKSNDSDDEDDDDFEVARMTDREVRQMFNDEVSFFVLGSVFELIFFVLAAPGCRSRCSFVV